MRALHLRLIAAIAVAISMAVGPSQLVAWEPPGPASVATIEFIDVGQGDAILIRSPEGKTALIDAGPSSDVVASIKALGLTSIDLVAVSHHHTDHYGGMRAVIQAFQPKFFLATSSSHTTSMYLKLLQTVKDNGVKMVEPLPHKPRRIELGSVVLTILPQPPLNDEEENDNSIGIRVEFGDISVLMTGDSEDDERAWWMKTCPSLLRDATILKLAHHGSRNGTDEKWLDIVAPELAVASLATGNSYGHPHSEALSRLKKKQIPLKRTDQEGSIRITTDGKRWRQSRVELAKRSTKSKSGASTRTR